MNEITLEAKTGNLQTVLDTLDEVLELCDCSAKVGMQLAIAVEEIFVNICSYAYVPDIGDATVRFVPAEDRKSISITFIDSGTPYNPLEKEDPDVTLPAEQRSIGGLGIFMVKKSMTDLKYEYKDGCNVFTITKNF